MYLLSAFLFVVLAFSLTISTMFLSRFSVTNLLTVPVVEKKALLGSQELQWLQDTHPKEEIWPSMETTLTSVQKVRENYISIFIFIIWIDSVVMSLVCRVHFCLEILHCYSVSWGGILSFNSPLSIINIVRLRRLDLKTITLLIVLGIV